MEFFISFFRDTIDGFWYFLYILLCIFFIFVLWGVVGDRKRYAIAEKLKDKRADDIASGKVARLAALESKQVLDVMENNTDNEEANVNEDLTKKEEAPSVLVIGADGSSNTNSGSVINDTPVVIGTSAPSTMGEVTNNQNNQGQVYATPQVIESVSPVQNSQNNG